MERFVYVDEALRGRLNEESYRAVARDVRLHHDWSELTGHSRYCIESAEERRAREAARGPLRRGLRRGAARLGNALMVSWALLLALVVVVGILSLVIHALSLPLIPGVAALVVLALFVAVWLN